MRKLLYIAFFAAVIMSLGCAITNYPVIFDTRGADADGVLDGQYDKALILPDDYYGQTATIWEDGSDELFTLVTQNWTGDQYLYTYNNFDPSGVINFLDHTYCDPTRNSADCAITTAWNPDLPDAYPHGDQGAGYNNVDDPFDYELDMSCSGARSLSLLASYDYRLGECGSGMWADRQGAAYEFSLLEKTNYRGKSYYHLPIDASVASFAVLGEDGAQADMPIYGRFNAYLDERLRTVIPMTPNAKYQLRWIDSWVNAHGHFAEVTTTYGSLNATFKLNVTSVKGALDRL